LLFQSLFCGCNEGLLLFIVMFSKFSVISGLYQTFWGRNARTDMINWSVKVQALSRYLQNLVAVGNGTLFCCCSLLWQKKYIYIYLLTEHIHHWICDWMSTTNKMKWMLCCQGYGLMILIILVGINTGTRHHINIYSTRSMGRK
jgi:hypothetical protein